MGTSGSQLGLAKPPCLVPGCQFCGHGNYFRVSVSGLWLPNLRQRDQAGPKGCRLSSRERGWGSPDTLAAHGVRTSVSVSLCGAEPGVLVSSGGLPQHLPRGCPVLPVCEVEDRVHPIQHFRYKRGQLHSLQDVSPVSSLLGFDIGFVSHLIPKWTCISCPF